VLWLHLAVVVSAAAQPITAAGQPARLDIRAAGEHSIRVTLKPIGVAGDFPFTPALSERSYPAPAMSLREITAPATGKVGTLKVDVRPNPLTVVVTNAAGQPVQTLVFEPDGTLSFGLDGQPVLGMGEGGLNLGKGVHPIDAMVPGLLDLFVFDAHEPALAMRDFSVITGPAAMPPSLGARLHAAASDSRR
jgi:alpha-glucosidase/alpha-D-xyloside xylohydrolase